MEVCYLVLLIYVCIINSCKLHKIIQLLTFLTALCVLLMFDLENNSWVKKNKSSFDVTMGSYDGPKVCELIGLFILNKISKIIDSKNVGLHRDDGFFFFV